MSVALRQRQFRLLFCGQIVSNLGDWLDFIALAVLIAYVWEMGPAALAALSIAIAIPWIFVAPFSGVLVDRWPKKRVLVGSDLLRGVIVGGLIFAPSLPVLLALVALKTTVATFFAPANQATIRIIVADAQLHCANALSQLVLQATKVVGPALGGLIVSVASPRFALGVDAATFLVSAAVLSRMLSIDAPIARGSGQADDEEGGYWAELREGLAYIASRRALVLCSISFSATIFLLFSFDTLAPLAFQQLGVSKSLFGLAVAGIGLGGVLGAIAVGRYGADVNPFALMGAGVSIVGCCVALVGTGLVTSLDAPPWVWTPVLVMVGIASSAILVASPTIIQRETPPELMGRVSTSASSIPTGLQMFAPIAGAALAEWQSVGFVFTAAGCGLAVLGVVVLAVRPPVGVSVELLAAAKVAGAASAEQDADTPPSAGAPPATASTGSDLAAEPAVPAGSSKGRAGRQSSGHVQTTRRNRCSTTWTS
ncbi:MAG: hypothetical protein QOD83_1456 [Solirubrobacteraceae bacterium]|jgi:predicted MFS family arabinose efflux permease|nr:hypothetical protein [Solirubrobacteraceae bacterium]